MAKPGKAKTKKAAAGFSREEKAAMRERAKEVKAQAGKAADENAVLAALAAMPEPDRSLGRRLHALIKANAPGLTAKTWYGMPAYARDGETICFFQNASKFKVRYATLGFSDKARLDDGQMWPTAFALKKLSGAEESRIIALLKKALA